MSENYKDRAEEVRNKGWNAEDQAKESGINLDNIKKKTRTKRTASHQSQEEKPQTSFGDLVSDIVSKVTKSKAFEEVVITPLCHGLIGGKDRATIELGIQGFKKALVTSFNLNIEGAKQVEGRIRHFVQEIEVFISGNAEELVSKESK